MNCTRRATAGDQIPLWMEIEAKERLFANNGVGHIRQKILLFIGH